MEVTASFNELLKAHSAPTTRQSFTIDQIDSFLKTASSINREITSLHHELSSIRQAYLSTAAPRKTHLRRNPGSESTEKQPVYLTDADRNVVDREAKNMLRALSARINVLTQEELKRQEAAAQAIKQRHARGLRGLTTWAAGGGLGAKDGTTAKSPEHAAAIEAERQIIEHRGGVLMYLQQKLQTAMTLQRTMMETRLAREMEKNRSVLAKARGAQQLPPSLAKEFGFDDVPKANISTSASVPFEEEEARKKQNQDLDLTDEQRQMFERDNQDMLKHYNSATEKVKTVEKSLTEIAELQSMLVDNLTIQSAHIEQLVADSERTEENVGGGNKQLKKATQRKFSQARVTFYAASALCSFLIIWDLII